jgi:hypothetical protein
LGGSNAIGVGAIGHAPDPWLDYRWGGAGGYVAYWADASSVTRVGPSWCMHPGVRVSMTCTTGGGARCNSLITLTLKSFPALHCSERDLHQSHVTTGSVTPGLKTWVPLLFPATPHLCLSPFTNQAFMTCHTTSQHLPEPSSWPLTLCHDWSHRLSGPASSRTPAHLSEPFL